MLGALRAPAAGTAALLRRRLLAYSLVATIPPDAAADAVFLAANWILPFGAMLLAQEKIDERDLLAVLGPRPAA